AATVFTISTFLSTLFNSIFFPLFSFLKTVAFVFFLSFLRRHPVHQLKLPPPPRPRQDVAAVLLLRVPPSSVYTREKARRGEAFEDDRMGAPAMDWTGCSRSPSLGVSYMGSILGEGVLQVSGVDALG
ncbi:hypothetical protein Tsubulata_045737, partial [Turnera subulata]